MFNILSLLVNFVWEAIQTHASSDEGKQELETILTAVEAAGIDVPFWEPSSQDIGNDVDGSESSADARATSFRDRHPDLYEAK